MKRFSRHLWMAALVAAFCPAASRAQSYAYYPAEIAGAPGVVPASAMSAATTDGCGWDWGMRADAFYGTNYRWDTSAGFETKWGTNGTFYGIAVPNLYAEGAYNNWTVRAGRFVSPVGYYTVGSPNNFFPVIPYTYQYGEPFTHTGVWALYKFSDSFTLGGAVTHGWDDTDNTGNPHGGGPITAYWTLDEN